MGAKREASFGYWLDQLAEEARETLSGTPLPTDKYNRQHLVDLNVFKAPERRKDATTRIPEVAGDFEVIDIDGAILKVSAEGRASREGVYVGDASGDVPHEVIEVFGSLRDHLLGENRFSRLVASLWSGITVVYIPPSCQLSDSIDILHVRSAENATLGHLTFIFAGPNSQARIFEEYIFEKRKDGAGLGGVFIYLSENARMEYNALIPFNELEGCVHHRRAFASAGASLTWNHGWFGCRYLRAEVKTFLQGPGAQVDERHFFFGEGKNFYDMDALLMHAAPATSGTSTVRGALAGTSRSVFRGLVHIVPEAKNSDSFLEDHVLLLSKGVRSDSVPALEILNNAVRASHSASSGHIDREKMFYLCSRGLDETEARNILVRGFFERALGRAWDNFKRRLISQTDEVLERI